jgi:RecJ-like exonuclease
LLKELENNSRFLNICLKADNLGHKIIQFIKQKKNIIIVAHNNADGIAAASILVTSFLKEGGRFIVRGIENIQPYFIKSLKNSYDLIIFCDLGFGISKYINKILGNKSCIIINHHKISQEEKDLEYIFNPFQFGFDGINEISSSGMAYLISKKINETNIDLSWLALIGAINKDQDQNEKQPSFFGLNRMILDDAIKCGKISIFNDLIFSEQTKPIHLSIANSITPFIPGLSGNENSSFATLSAFGIELKVKDKWRTIKDLSEVEKKKVKDSISSYMIPSIIGNTSEKIFGEDYILEKEEENLPLRTVREFANLLDACGSIKKTGIGISICLGERNKIFEYSEIIFQKYKKSICEIILKIVNNEMTVVEKKNYIIINGDGFIPEEMVNSISSVLMKMSKFKYKILIVKTVTKEGNQKVLIKKRYDHNLSIKSQSIFDGIISKFGNSYEWNGFELVIKITNSQFEELLNFIEKSIDGKNEGRN